MSNEYYVYILANYTNSVLYIGVTRDLVKRIWEHKGKFTEGFTSKYHIWKLVYYEVYNNIEISIKREKQLKNWRRDKKLLLIRKENPTFRELTIQ